jgi:hypothetical protein
VKYEDSMPPIDSAEFPAWQKRHALYGLVDLAENPEYTELANALIAVLTGDTDALERVKMECEKVLAR